MLTPAQHEAVTHPGGPLLVIGGAGTGKTRILVERVGWLAAEQAVPPEAILALTFSAPAADALRERIEARLGAPPAEDLPVTTFQSLCARLLHDEALEAGVDPFATPVSPADRLAMLLEAIDDLPLRHHDLRGNPSALLGSIVGRIDRLKGELVTCEDYAAWAATLGEGDPGRADREREFAQLFRAHDRLLAEAGTLDYGDLVLHAFRLLRERPHVRARVARRFGHVLVDELQDANFAQGLLLRLLVGEHGNVTAVADNDQAIHRFRGAADKNVRDFLAEWPQATVIRLEESFRSRETILRAAGADVRAVPARSASESSPPSTPSTTGCWPRPGRWTSATSSCTPSGSCASARTCVRAWAGATATSSWTSSRTRTSPRACSCGCSGPSTET